MCGRTDRPIAGLLKDLKRRGLFDSTLVIWGGEFGRMPMSERGTGRDHNPHGFAVWMAGAGIKGGTVHGATDAVGLRAEVDRVHVHDLHATILHLLGIDHTRLTFLHNGRERAADRRGRRGGPADPGLKISEDAEFRRDKTKRERYEQFNTSDCSRLRLALRPLCGPLR